MTVEERSNITCFLETEFFLGPPYAGWAQQMPRGRPRTSSLGRPYRRRSMRGCNVAMGAMSVVSTPSGFDNPNSTNNSTIAQAPKGELRGCRGSV
jgi:hypothetical protein